MLYKIITGDRIITVIIIFLIAAGIWVPAFLSPEIAETRGMDSSMPLYLFSINLFGGRMLLSKILAFGLMIFEAFLLVRINARLVLVQEKTFLPALFFIIIAGHSADLLQWNPVLPAALFVIFVLELIFRSNHDEPNSYKYFEAGMLLGIGSLFYAPLVYMIVFIWIGCMAQRPFYWREYVFPVLGLAVPYVFVFAFLFMGDKSIPDFLTGMQSDFVFTYDFPHFYWKTWVFTLYVAFLALVSSVFLLKVFQFRKIYIRDYFLVLFWLFIISLLVFLLLSGFNTGMSYLIGISIAYILTNYFINARKSIGNKVILYLLLGYVLGMGVVNLIG